MTKVGALDPDEVTQLTRVRLPKSLVDQLREIAAEETRLSQVKVTTSDVMRRFVAKSLAQYSPWVVTSG